MSNSNNSSIKWQDARLDLSQKYTEPPIILKVDDSIVFTLGNFSASAGKEKSKKTFNVTALTASLLSANPILNYIPNPPADRDKVLYVDTEQSNYHCYKVASRIERLSKLREDDFQERLIFLALRKFAPQSRIDIIEQAIYANPDVFLVIIDGLRDLVLDINSPSESTEIMSKLLRWTDERNIHIHSVLHLNKGDDNTRGHLGTELNNKAETILQITKSDIDSSSSIVSAKTVRDIEFDEFAFLINKDGLPELLENYTSTNTEPFTYNELTDQEHRKALELCFSTVTQQGYSELIENLQRAYRDAIGLDMGISKTKRLKVFLSNKRMIIQKEKKYEFNPQYHF